MKFSLGRRRRRLYARTFDWDEARRLHASGWSFADIARKLGVDRRGVARVCKLPKSYVAEATQEQVDALAMRLGRDQIPCPRCFGPMTRTSELCRDCRNEMRLDSMTVRTVPGTPGSSRIELRSVALHRIVEVDGDYGVVVPYPGIPHGYRCVEFLDGPYLVEGRVRVRVLPAKEVLVGGVVQEGEEIE